MKPLNIIFAGTPDFAAIHLQALLASEHRVVAVYTRADKAAGRGKKIMQSPVKTLALAHNIPVFQPLTFRNHQENIAEFQKIDADVMVVVAYGLILPQEILNTPRFGCINVHGSLLPRWRGAAPIQRAIVAGDNKTGITIMQMDEGLDTGDMLLKVECDLKSDETSQSLYEKLAHIAPPALLKVLNRLSTNPYPPHKQDDRLATFAPKLSKEEAQLDFTHSASLLERTIRAYSPSGCFIEIIRGDKRERVKIHRADVLDYSGTEPPGMVLKVSEKGIDIQSARGILRLTEIQPSGKKSMNIRNFLNGYSDWFYPRMQIVRR